MHAGLAVPGGLHMHAPHAPSWCALCAHNSSASGCDPGASAHASSSTWPCVGTYSRVVPTTCASCPVLQDLLNHPFLNPDRVAAPPASLPPAQPAAAGGQLTEDQLKSIVSQVCAIGLSVRVLCVHLFVCLCAREKGTFVCLCERGKGMFVCLCARVRVSGLRLPTPSLCWHSADTSLTIACSTVHADCTSWGLW